MDPRKNQLIVALLHERGPKGHNKWWNASGSVAKHKLFKWVVQRSSEDRKKPTKNRGLERLCNKIIDMYLYKRYESEH